MYELFRIALPIVMFLDLFLPFVIAVPYRGYSHLNMALSVLGNRKSPLRLVYNVWQILSGAVFVWAGYVAYLAFHAMYPVMGMLLFVCLAAYGIGCEIISALFPVEDSKETVTTASTIHAVFSVLGFMALLCTPLFLGIMQIGMTLTGKGVFSVVFFALALLCMVLFVMSDKPEMKGKWFAHEGLWQRATLALLYIPLLVGL